MNWAKFERKNGYFRNAAILAVKHARMPSGHDLMSKTRGINNFGKYCHEYQGLQNRYSQSNKIKANQPKNLRPVAKLTFSEFGMIVISKSYKSVCFQCGYIMLPPGDLLATGNLSPKLQHRPIIVVCSRSILFTLWWKHSPCHQLVC